MKALLTILLCLFIFVVPAFAEDLETVSGSVISSEIQKIGKESVYNGILNYNESIEIPVVYMNQLPKNSKNWSLENRKRRSLSSRGSLDRARDISHRSNPLEISSIIEKCAKGFDLCEMSLALSRLPLEERDLLFLFSKLQFLEFLGS